MNRCSDSDVLHLGMHSINICIIGFLDPFLGGLSDFFLNFLLCVVGLTPGGDLLDFRHNDIHYMWTSGHCVAYWPGWLHLKHVVEPFGVGSLRESGGNH